MKFVNALTQPLAIRVQKNVAPLAVQRKRHAADFGMFKRFAAANPQYWRRRLYGGSDGLRGAAAVFVRHILCMIFV